MGIEKSRKNEQMVEAMENSFDKILCLVIGQNVMDSSNLDRLLNIEDMEKYKIIYDEYKSLMIDFKEWAKEQDDTDHIMMCSMFDMRKQLDRIEHKIERQIKI